MVIKPQGGMMKKSFMYIFVGIIFFTHALVYCFGKKTIFGIRSQGLDSVLELTGWQQQIYKYDQDNNYGTLAAAAKYTRSIRSDEIACFLFGAEKLRFSGSQAVRKSGDILADYFGLPVDFYSTVIFSPHISNTIIDFDWFQALDAYVTGLFVMVHLPVVQTKWNLYMQEIGINPGTAFYPAGYMSNARIAASSLPHSVTQAMQGMTTFGDMQEPLQYGKILGRQTRSRIAELQTTVGWNYNQPWYHAGISVRVGAPTGNATNAEFLFEEIVGNRHHWDVGIGLSGHVNMWENKEKGKRAALYLDAHISHLCASKQKRSFDFINNGTGSRYMLLEQVDNLAQTLLINGATPSNQYIGKLFPAINYTTFDTKISIGVQTDITLKFAYQHDGFEVDLGYNFWFNSKEKLLSRDAFIENRFALKGDAQVYGFTAVGNNPVALNATQHSATLLAGQGSGNSNYQNSNADNLPALASTLAGILNQLNTQDSTDLGIAQVQVNGSNPSIFLTNKDINTESGILPRALSNKVFGYIGGLWNNRDDIDPYLGIGLSGEFAHTDPDCNAMCSQWAIWVKGGIAY
jgi:hypothetical protein